MKAENKITEIKITDPAAVQAFKAFMAEKKERALDQQEALKEYAAKLKKPAL